MIKRRKETWNSFDVSLYKKNTFGIIGTHHGAGCTMIALNFAYFLSRQMSGKTAYVEVMPGTDMEKLESVILKKRKLCDGRGSFRIDDVTVFKSVSVMEIPRILNEEECNYVFDFGMANVMNLNEFLRCDTKIVICNLAPWKRTYVDEFMNEVKHWNGYKGWNYIANFSVGDAHKYYLLDDMIKLKKMPVLESYFEVTDEVMRLYRSFL